jgi:hypothetical protein
LQPEVREISRSKGFAPQPPIMQNMRESPSEALFSKNSLLNSLLAGNLRVETGSIWAGCIHHHAVPRLRRFPSRRNQLITGEDGTITWKVWSTTMQNAQPPDADGWVVRF